MAVITDVGDEEKIHPPRKEPVGERLALAAATGGLRREDQVYSGPAYDQGEVRRRARRSCSFTHVGKRRKVAAPTAS